MEEDQIPITPSNFADTWIDSEEQTLKELEEWKSERQQLKQQRN